MSDSVSSVWPEYNAAVLPQIHQLAPSPECEVFAVAFLEFFEVFRRLPILLFVEEFFVGNIFALRQKLTNLFDRAAANREWPAYIAA
jgi:hypothetical protein